MQHSQPFRAAPGRPPRRGNVVGAAVGMAVISLLFAAACGGASDDVRIEVVDGTPLTSAGSGRPESGRSPVPVTVFIDAGHGGGDPGWGASYVAPNLPPEKDLNLDVARRTAAYLEAAGYRVVLSRDEDIQLNDPKQDLNGDGCIDPIDEIQARIDKANASGAAVLLSVHFNGQPGSNFSGPGTFYNAVREFAAENRRLAELIQAAQLQTLADFGHRARDWGVIRDDSLATGNRSECLTSKYYALLGPALAGRPRPSQMPGVIAEAMFVTDPTEAALAARAEVRDALARAYAGALQRFLSGGHPAPPDASPTGGSAGR
jgi:N-acetylmuramoyl-L-alanine amidase